MPGRITRIICVLMLFSALIPLCADNDLYISGRKVFRIRKTLHTGNLSRFLTDYQDWSPGFKLNQSLQLEIDGNIGEDVSVSAYLDDSDFDQEDKFMTLNINSQHYMLTLGDFKVSQPANRYAVFNKKVKGVQATGFLPHDQSIYLLYTRSEGREATKLFRGRGNSKEYRLDPSRLPVIENSERVKIGNRVLVQGEDYMIDNDEGRILIKTHLLPIEPEVIVSVEYEYEEGSQGYKRNLYGSRYERKFGKRGLWNLEIYGLKDNQGKRVSGGEEDTDKPPISHYIIGNHLELSGRNTSLSADWAKCHKDNDLTNNFIQQGSFHKSSAWKLNLAHSSSNNGRFTALSEKRDPDFSVIGKKDSYRYNELNAFSAHLWPSCRFKPVFAYQKGETLIFQDPELLIAESDEPVRANDSDRSGSFTLDLPEKLFMSGSYSESRKENLSSFLMSRDRNRSLTVTKKWNKVDLTSSVSKRRFLQVLKPLETYFLDNRSITLSYSPSTRTGMSVDFSTSDKDDLFQWVNSSENTGISFHTFMGRNYQSNLDFRKRKTDDRQGNAQESNAVEGKLKFNFKRKASGYFKYLQENLFRLNFTGNGEYNETPVLSRDLSFTVRFNPMKKLENSFFSKYKLKERRDLSLAETKYTIVRNRANLRMGRNTLSLLSSYTKRLAEVNPASNTEISNGLQWYLAASDRTSFNLSASRTERRDHLFHENGENKNEYKTEFEQYFSQKFSFNASCGFDIIKKKNGYGERNQTLSLNMDYKPDEKWFFAWETEREVSVKNSRRLTDLSRFRVSSELSRDMELSSYVNFVKSKDEESDNYTAKMFNLEITISF